jgi:hypothetical protein
MIVLQASCRKALDQMMKVGYVRQKMTHLALWDSCPPGPTLALAILKSQRWSTVAHSASTHGILEIVYREQSWNCVASRRDDPLTDRLSRSADERRWSPHHVQHRLRNVRLVVKQGWNKLPPHNGDSTSIMSRTSGWWRSSGYVERWSRPEETWAGPVSSTFKASAAYATVPRTRLNPRFILPIASSKNFYAQTPSAPALFPPSFRTFCSHLACQYTPDVRSGRPAWLFTSTTPSAVRPTSRLSAATPYLSPLPLPPCMQLSTLDRRPHNFIARNTIVVVLRRRTTNDETKRGLPASISFAHICTCTCPISTKYSQIHPAQDTSADSLHQCTP